MRPTLVVTNPPWDLRLSEGAEESWEALGRFLRREAPGANAWTLSGTPALTRGLRMRADAKVTIEQAGLKLRLSKYRVLEQQQQQQPPPPQPRDDDDDERNPGQRSRGTEAQIQMRGHDCD
jgi:hypothetical protein